MKIAKFIAPLLLLATSSSSYANGWRFDQITRCEMEVGSPSPFTHFANIPCWAGAFFS